MRKLSLLILFNILIFSATKINASHIAGGHITYTNIGKDSFIVTLTLIRDCKGSETIKDAQIKVFCETNNQILLQPTLTKPVPVDITPVCPGTCSRCDSASCSLPLGIEKYEYQTLIVLTSIQCCELKLAFGVGNRSTQISTGMSGETMYIESRLNKCLAPQNSSPKFNSNLFSLACTGQNVLLDFSTTDTDIDSVGNSVDSFTYELINPMGFDAVNLNYKKPYNFNIPVYFDGFPDDKQPLPKGFHFNQQTGLLNFKPTKIELTVLAVRVNEYRNGVKIGDVMMDQMLMVISCPTTSTPEIAIDKMPGICEGDTVEINFSFTDPKVNEKLIVDYFTTAPGADFMIYKDTSSINNDSILKGKFYWITNASHSGNEYYLTINVRDNFCPINNFDSRTFSLFVKSKPDSFSVSKTFENCADLKLKLNVYPSSIAETKWTFQKPDKTFSSDNEIIFPFVKDVRDYPFYIKARNMKTVCDFEFSDTFSFEFDTPEDQFLCSTSQDIYLPIKSTGDNSSWLGKNVYIDSTDFYFSPKNILNGESNWLYFQSEILNSTCTDSFKVTVFDGSKPALDDSVNVCELADSFKLTAIPNTGLWFGNDDIRGSFFHDLEKNKGSNWIYYQIGTDECLNIDSMLVNVHPSQNFKIKSDKNFYCEGDSIFLRVENLKSNFRWTKISDGRFLKNTTNPENIIVLDSLPYSPVRISLEAESSDSFCPGYLSDYIINYYKNPEADFIADPTFGHPPFVAFFYDDSKRNGGSELIYEWDFGNGETRNGNNTFANYTQNGSYDVKLKITTHANCIDSIIKKDYVLAVPVSVDEGKLNDFRIYPNPAKDFVFISSESTLRAIKVFNLSGEMIYHISKINQNTFRLDLSKQPKGIYFLEAENVQGEVFRKKIIVE